MILGRFFVKQNIEPYKGGDMAINVSATKLRNFQECPMMYWLAHHSDANVPQWVKKVFGTAIHCWVGRQYRLNPEQRQARLELGKTMLFAQTAKSAANIWHSIWTEAEKEENANPKIFPRGCKIRFEEKTAKQVREEKEQYRAMGAGMAIKYWQDNHDAPFPEAVEKRFGPIPCPGRNDVHLVGVIDQIRLIKDQLWVVDIKSGYPDYGENDARVQYSVHYDIQFTIYSLAVRHLYGTREAGIIRYPMGYQRSTDTGKKTDKKIVITTRGEAHYQELSSMIDFFIACLETGIFPRYPGRVCQTCDYLELCAPVDLFYTKSIPTGKFSWGRINKRKTVQGIRKQVDVPKFSRPRLL